MCTQGRKDPDRHCGHVNITSDKCDEPLGSAETQVKMTVDKKMKKDLSKQHHSPQSVRLYVAATS